MPRKFTQIAFTPTVKAIQDRYGSQIQLFGQPQRRLELDNPFRTRPHARDQGTGVVIA